MANIINIYTLSNGYTVEIHSVGPKRNAVLYSSSHELISEGLQSFSTDESILVDTILMGQWNDERIRPSVIKSQTPPPPIVKPTTTTQLFRLEGKVIDSSKNNPLPGILVSITTKGLNQKIEVKTDKDGVYNLNITLEILLSTDLPNEKPQINFSDPSGKYSDNSIIPFTQDGYLLMNPSPVKLKSKQIDLDEQISQYKQTGNDTIRKMKNMIPKNPEEALINFIKSQVKILLKTMLPAVLGMLAAFGIDKLQDFLKGRTGTCPKKSKLDELIKLRNQIVIQLNNISKLLDVLIISVGIMQGLMGVLKITFNILLALPIPLPPFVPSNVVQGTANVIQSLQKLVDKFSNVNITVLIALMIIKSVIALILSLLKTLDALLLFCNPNAFDQLIELDPALNTLQDELNPEVQTDNSLIRKLNGFTLEIQLIELDMVGGLKRKQAVAKNSQNIIILSEEPSFSADEQILLDELEFYIKSNNLKAY